MAIDKKLIDELLTNYKKPEDLIGENGLLKELTKAILERALTVEMSDHLGYEKHDPAGQHSGNAQRKKQKDVEMGLRRVRTGNASGSRQYNPDAVDLEGSPRRC